MRAHYLQHVPFEGLGAIDPWLRAKGFSIAATRFFAEDSLPAIEEVDFLIIMGGPMSVNDTERYPWLKGEKQFIREFIATGKPVVGICLGSQLIASALGACVARNPQKEIGWFPIRSVDHPSPEVFQFPECCEVFHWHGETFTLPTGAIRLAESEACPNQAFQLGKNVMGMQFHLENTEESITQLIENCRDDLTEGEFIQPENEIKGASAERFAKLHRLMDQVLTYLWNAAGGRAGERSASGSSVD